MFTLTNGTISVGGVPSVCTYDAGSLLFGLLAPVLLAVSIAALMALLRRLRDASTVYGDRVREHASGPRSKSVPSASAAPKAS